MDGDGEGDLREDDADVEQELRNCWSVQTGTVCDRSEPQILKVGRELKNTQKKQETTKRSKYINHA